MERASGRLQVDMLEILKSEDRINAGKTAQAQGLFFLGAEYKNLQLAQSNHTHSFLSTLLNSK